MSLATLKKKTAHKYRNNSVNQPQFSINGTYRNQGYIGQTSLSRTILRTPAKGPVFHGHGSCCGTYAIHELVPSVFSTENNRVVKPSVLSSKAMIENKTQWSRRPFPFSSTKKMSSDIYSQSSFIEAKRKACKGNDEGSNPSLSNCNNIVKPSPLWTTQNERILRMIDSCS